MTSGGAVPVPVVLIEDHDGTRMALADSFARFADRLRLVAAFRDAESFLGSAAVHSQTLEVALVDLGLPGMGGIDLIRRLATRAPHVRAIALTAFQDEESVLDALANGAYGYIVKDEPMPRIVSAVEEAAAGEHPVSSRVVGFLITQARKAPPPAALTAREEELAASLAQGLSYAECAARMAITLGTVQTHVKRLYRKLGVSSRGEVRDWVRRHLPSP